MISLLLRKCLLILTSVAYCYTLTYVILVSHNLRIFGECMFECLVVVTLCGEVTRNDVYSSGVLIWD